MINQIFLSGIAAVLMLCTVVLIMAAIGSLLYIYVDHKTNEKEIDNDSANN